MAIKPVIFYDGICIFCDSFVGFIIKRDKGKFCLCQLQSEAAKKLSAKYGFQIKSENPDSLILLKNGKSYDKSTAAIMILRELGGAWKIMGALLIIPKSWRDKAYDYFGKNRYKWFGKKASCEVNKREIKQRLIE